MNRAIGGYFELELPDYGGFLHDDGILLNSGGNALEYVIRSLADVRHLWIPYYTCSVVLEQVDKAGIPYSLYPIDENLEIKDQMHLLEGDYLVYTNYFGIKDRYVRWLSGLCGEHLIVDSTQAWFSSPIHGTSSFYSPRKYMGLPDGGVAYCPRHLDECVYGTDTSYERCAHLLKRIDLGPSEGYADFRSNSLELAGQPVKKMSELTRKLLCSIDFTRVKRIRIQNFEYLHQHLKGANLFPVPPLDSFVCPMVYPYLTNDKSLRQKLIENKVFVATYWLNVKEWTETGMLEEELVDNLIPLPIDQRYSTADMDRIIRIIKK